MTPRTGRRGSQSDGGALEEPLVRPGFASSPPVRRVARLSPSMARRHLESRRTDD
jgi:hypothetical protein